MNRLSFCFSFLIIGLLFSSCSDERDSIQPQQSDITESVYSSTTIQPDSLYEVYASATGIVESIFVDEGDLVSAGQILLKINNDKFQYQEQNAALNVELAKENYEGKAAILNDLKDQIQIAELKFKNDSANYERQRRIHEKGVGSEVEFEARKLSYESAKNNLQILKQQYIRNKRELETALKQAKLNYQTNASSVEDHLVISKMNGKVYDVLKKRGELINGQIPIALIGSTKNFIIEMLVDEVDIVKIKKGQDVIISLDAYKNQVFQAKVNKIYPNKNQRTQTFKIEGVFIDPPEVLYPGLSGEANIIIQERKNAITIPLEYLTENNEVETKDGFVKVETGIKNMTIVEITTGIDTNSTLYLPLQ